MCYTVYIGLNKTITFFPADRPHTSYVATFFSAAKFNADEENCEIAETQYASDSQVMNKLSRQILSTPMAMDHLFTFLIVRTMSACCSGPLSRDDVFRK